MSYRDRYEASEDLFADTRMSFGEHIEDLRSHMLLAIYGLLIAMCFSFLLAKPVLRFIATPVERELTRVYDQRFAELQQRIQDNDPTLADLNKPREIELVLERKQLERHVVLQPGDGKDDKIAWNVTIRDPGGLQIAAEVEKQIGARPTSLASFSATEGLIAWLKVWLYCSIVLSSPWIFYQFWSFVAAGLYPHEKRGVHTYLPVSVGLFLVGVAMCEFVVIPKALEYLLSFNEWLGLKPDLRLSEWLSFAIITPLVFGIAFQTPLVMLFLERLGIMSVDTYRRHRRMAMFLMAIIAIVLTPSPDAFSYLALTMTLWGIYELGIVFCRFAPRREPGLDVPSPEEMVEV